MDFRAQSFVIFCNLALVLRAVWLFYACQRLLLQSRYQIFECSLALLTDKVFLIAEQDIWVLIFIYIISWILRWFPFILKTYWQIKKKKKKKIIEYHTRCSLMVGVLVLYLEKSDSSDSPNKTLVVHVLLPITVTWRGVNEPIPESPLFYLAIYIYIYILDLKYYCTY